MHTNQSAIAHPKRALREGFCSTKSLVCVCVCVCAQGHHAEVRALAVSPCGHFVVSSSHDLSLRLWEKTDSMLILEEEREQVSLRQVCQCCLWLVLSYLGYISFLCVSVVCCGNF